MTSIISIKLSLLHLEYDKIRIYKRILNLFFLNLTIKIIY